MLGNSCHIINDLQLNVDMLKIIHDNPNLLAKYDTVIFNMFDLLRDLYLETGNQFNNKE